MTTYAVSELPGKPTWRSKKKFTYRKRLRTRRRFKAAGEVVMKHLFLRSATADILWRRPRKKRFR